MELAGPRRRRTVRIGGGFAFPGALLGAAVAVLASTPATTMPVALLGAAVIAGAWTLYRCYSRGTP